MIDEKINTTTYNPEKPKESHMLVFGRANYEVDFGQAYWGLPAQERPSPADWVLSNMKKVLDDEIPKLFPSEEQEMQTVVGQIDLLQQLRTHYIQDKFADMPAPAYMGDMSRDELIQTMVDRTENPRGGRYRDTPLAREAVEERIEYLATEVTLHLERAGKRGSDDWHMMQNPLATIVEVSK
jgi:hypothetical protein